MQLLTRRGYKLRLSEKFLQLSRHDYLDLDQIFQHFIVLGETGSGKTTGPGTVIPEQAMRLGFGMVIFAFKNELPRIISMAKRTGREQSLVVVEPGGVWRCNVLDWEINRAGAGASVDNASALLHEIVMHGGPSGKHETKESIWPDSATRGIRHSMLLLTLAGKRVTLDNIKAMIDGVPDAGRDGLNWPRDSLVKECLTTASARGAPGDLYRQCETYFCRELPRPGNERFASSVFSTIYNSTDALQSRVVKELFLADAPTFDVSFPLQGAIVVLNLPVVEHAAGRSAQLLFKAAFVNEALRRKGLQGGRPVMMVMDEYQGLATALDQKAMQMLRESWVSVLALTQNLPNLFSVMEPGRAHDVVESMLGNFATVILCRNRCRVSNHWASETIGKQLVARANWGHNNSEGTNRGGNRGNNYGTSHNSTGQASASGGYSSGSSWGSSSSVGYNSGYREERDFAIPEEVFVSLSVGGGYVQSVLMKAGKEFRANGGKPFMGVLWPQRG